MSSDLQALPTDYHQRILENTPDAIIFCDLDGTIRLWNEGALRVFGFSREEAVGANLDLIIPERFRAAHWKGFEAAMAAGKPRHGAEIRLTRGLHKEGEARKLYVEMSFGVVVDADGKSIGALAMARDATDKQAAERALKERLAALEGKSASH